MSHHPPHYPAPPAAVLRSCHQRHSSLHWQRLAIFGVLYFGAASTAVWLAAQASAGAWYNWLLVIPFYLLAAASLHGISLFTHEAVHGTLCENVKLNYALGAVCAWPVLQNFSAYRVLHLDHHAHLGDDGDPDHYANYTRWTWMVFTLNWLRLLVGYPVYIVAIPILAWRQGTVRDRIGIAAEVLAVVGIAVAVILSGVPWNWLLHGWLMPMVFINTMVNIRGMSQHTLLEHATDEVQ
ncbi:MAG TPA: fatty acid desaturase, partial [Candidatus Methylacidiphilales bacterium]|nr:fatty acid desaturase [Candidatus Methylacidiphilales bacterium]